MKQTIRLSESQLTDVIRKTVRKVMKEGEYYEKPNPERTKDNKERYGNYMSDNMKKSIENVIKNILDKQTKVKYNISITTNTMDYIEAQITLIPPVEIINANKEYELDLEKINSEVLNPKAISYYKNNLNDSFSNQRESIYLKYGFEIRKWDKYVSNSIDNILNTLNRKMYNKKFEYGDLITPPWGYAYLDGEEPIILELSYK